MPYRKIHTSIWSDPWFESLPALAKHSFFYFITNDHCGQAGLYSLSLRRMAFDTGINEDESVAILKILEPKVYYEDGWVWVVNFLKYQTSSPKFLLAAYRQAMEAPRELFAHWCEYNRKYLSQIAGIQSQLQSDPADALPEEHSYPVDTVSIPSACGTDTSPLPSPYPIDTLSTGETQTGTETETQQKQHIQENNTTIMPLDKVQASVARVVSCENVFVSLLALLPAKYQSNPTVLKELKTAHERYGGEQAKAAILYTNAHFKTNYPAYLAKALTNGWSIHVSEEHPPKPREPPAYEQEEQVAFARRKEVFMALSPEQQEREIDLTIKKNRLMQGRSREVLEMATIHRLMEEDMASK